MSDKIDKAWTSLKKWAGACASNATVEDLKAALEKGENAIWAAQIRGVFNGKPGAGEKLGKVREGLGKIKETLEKVQNVCIDIQAVGRIHDAVRVLNDDSVIWTDTEKAARAFGDLFVGFGRLCRHLPSPAKEWGTFLESAGDFFVDMNRLFAPATRPSFTEQWSAIFDDGR